VTPLQRTLGRHALGLRDDNKRSYRNSFVTGPKNANYGVLMRMVEDGVATRERFGAHPENRYVFHLTKVGAEQCLDPGESLSTEDF
jgi:hypothetical protein